MTKTYQNKVARDHRQELTDRLIERMEAAIKYEIPWVTCSTAPFNPITGTKYTGVNFVSTLSKGYDDPRWYTFLQVKTLANESEHPIFVKPKEQGTAIFHGRKITINDKEKEASNDDGAESSDTKTIFVLDFSAYIFNASQIEGLPPYVTEATEFEAQLAVKNLVSAFENDSKLSIVHRYSEGAYYIPSEDTVVMPETSQFKSESLYYRTLLHELGHATGHPSRLNRDMSGRNQSANQEALEKYAFEELVAELTSYYMGAELGLPYDSRTHDNHASYLKSWLSALKKDKNLLFRAASQAGRAADFQKELLLNQAKATTLLLAA